MGMVWNALALQYRLGFQASSDHISTHISYAIALAEDTAAQAILDAFSSGTATPRPTTSCWTSAAAST